MKNRLQTYLYHNVSIACVCRLPIAHSVMEQRGGPLAPRPLRPGGGAADPPCPGLLRRLLPVYGQEPGGTGAGSCGTEGPGCVSYIGVLMVTVLNDEGWGGAVVVYGPKNVLCLAFLA